MSVIAADPDRESLSGDVLAESEMDCVQRDIVRPVGDLCGLG